MQQLAPDQADGLRRLMAASTARRIALVAGAPGTGDCSVARNLAAACVQQGKGVLLLDEHSGWRQAPPKHTGQLVLVDAVPGSNGALSPLAAGSDHIVVVCATTSDALTRTYLCIKKLHHAHGLANLRVLVTEVADAALARRLFANLAATASRFLGMALEPAGVVRADAHLAQARRLNLAVVQAFEASAAAQDFLQIATSLASWPCVAAARHSPLPLSGQIADRIRQPAAGPH